MSQVKSVIILYGGKVVKKHIMDPQKTSKDLISENREESVESLTSISSCTNQAKEIKQQSRNL